MLQLKLALVPSVFTLALVSVSWVMSTGAVRASEKCMDSQTVRHLATSTGTIGLIAPLTANAGILHHGIRLFGSA